MPFNLLVRDEAVWVTPANNGEDGFAVQIGSAKAGTRLKMMSEATGSGVVVLAEGAGDIRAAMNL
jgi:hypothetical protein